MGRTTASVREARYTKKDAQTQLGEKVEALRTNLSALRYMKDRQTPPKQKDVTQLPGGGEFKVGEFWSHCKQMRRCSGPPYARLLDNAVLGADYRVHRGT